MTDRARVNESQPVIHVVVPASGVGRRMQAAIPKQYLFVSGKPVLQWTLERLWQVFVPANTVVALSPEDQLWQQHMPDTPAFKQVMQCEGGVERAQSVLNALHYCCQQKSVTSQDWVLVHDAARPCVPLADLLTLKQLVIDAAMPSSIRSISRQPQQTGYVLGVPVTDSLKQVDQQARVQRSCSREALWRAFTPQLFRLQALQAALSAALASGLSPTDESQAMLAAGQAITMVAGSEDNIKVTHQQDLSRVERILQWHLSG